MAPDDGSRRGVHPTADAGRRVGHSLRVLVADGRGRRVRAGALASWLRRAAPPAAKGTVSVALVGSARMRALNRIYRHADYATDVLSFPAADRRDRRRGVAALHDDLLGDIVIARPVARRQAREEGHSEATELRVLALHGLLHLLGYDHQRDRGRMRRLEQRLRRRGGLREGLIERSGAAPPAGREERRASRS